ncbi:hypothetical protein ACFCT7_00495 [Fulvivirgaceae bacterium LMO-SS25]
MKNIVLLFTLLIHLTACSQTPKGKQHIAVCEEGKGCRVIELKAVPGEIDKLLNRTGFWINASDTATLVIENCIQKIEKKLSLNEIHQSYQGKGEPKKLSSFDLQEYLKEKGCLSNCANAAKKISFHINITGEDAVSGNGYFFLNVKAGEAYMPNESVQQFYGSEMDGIVLNQFLRNGAMESYTIAEGQKFLTKMPIGTNMSIIKNDAFNEQHFKTDFKETRNTRKHLNTNNIEIEYTGKDDEGKTMSFWITPAMDVCLPKGKFDAFGFYNLGYISIDGITYLVTEISGSRYQIKLTAISDGSYNFNPAGYKSIGR